MNRLLIICGPTAIGKTSTAINLAKIFGGEIVSADSRQVYTGMNIGTGKDLSKNDKPQMLNNKLPCFYEVKGIRVWGYDLVGPDKDYSIANYVLVARNIIKNIWQRGKLPIIVGGSGLYIKALVEGIETINIPKNEKLRLDLKDKKSEVLFQFLKKINLKKSKSLNESDSKNPRRLIRAIEVAVFYSNADRFLDSKNINNSTINQSINRLVDTDIDILNIGLIINRIELKKKIVQRVKSRIKIGFENEVKDLLAKGIKWKNQSMQSMGYRQYGDYIKNNLSKKDFVDLWIKKEVQYAKRQMTWFLKDKKIKWYNINNKGYLKAIEKDIKQWYPSDIIND